MKPTLTAAIPLLWLTTCGMALATDTPRAGTPQTIAAVTASHHPGLTPSRYPSAGADPLAAALAQPGTLLLLPLGVLGLAWSQRRRNP